MFKTFDRKLFRRQCRYLYLFIPTLIYFFLLILYPQIQEVIYGRSNVECYTKNTVIRIDQYIFSWFYDSINYSFNNGLLVVFAIPYLIHFINPIVYLIYMACTRPGYNYFWKFVLSFGLTCSFSIIIEASYPTGPPWYYLGLPNQAKFYLVDNLFHFKVFHTLYGLNKLICGAFPSLHVSWPTVIAMNGLMHPYFGVIYVTLIASAAVYSRHHWIIDITFGLFIAIGMSLLAGRIVNWLQIPQQRKDTFVEQKVQYKMQEKHQLQL